MSAQTYRYERSVEVEEFAEDVRQYLIYLRREVTQGKVPSNRNHGLAKFMIFWLECRDRGGEPCEPDYGL
jgi:hypothetical protein